MAETLLKVVDLKMHFPVKSGFLNFARKHVYAVDGVSFELQRGETLGLVGESGCGKSTLGRAILRLYEPTSGQIFFENKNILTLSQADLRALRRTMQIVFQDPYSSLNPRMRVREILAEPFEIHQLYSKSETEIKVRELLAEVGLAEDAISRYPHEFSGGQRQRIGIARALALRPKLIVADEPVSALDVSIQSQILNLMMDLKKKFQLSYVFIAHDLAVIQHISDKVAVMYLGRIVELTSAHNIYKSALHPYSRALIAAVPKPEVSRNQKQAPVSGDVPSPIDPPPGCHFHTRCPHAQDRCRMESPTLRNVSSDEPHWVACHYATEI